MRTSEQHLCSTRDCQQPVAKDVGQYIMMTRQFFGPFGGKMVYGYCQQCIQRNIRIYSSIVVVILLLGIGLIQFWV